MRKDMSRVIVTRPRIVDELPRKGRRVDNDQLPHTIGMRRSMRQKGGLKRLNENLSPLRRYLEKQVGRPWNKVYSEISTNLRVRSTVQMHVRDHLRDFVNLHPRIVYQSIWLRDGTRERVETGWPQLLYVDPRDGILKRSISHPDIRRLRVHPPRL